MERGCQLFTQWGWENVGGVFSLDYEVVQCPSADVNIIQNAFGADGPTTKPFYCNYNNCNGEVKGGPWCNYAPDHCTGPCKGQACFQI